VQVYVVQRIKYHRESNITSDIEVSCRMTVSMTGHAGMIEASYVLLPNFDLHGLILHGWSGGACLYSM